MLLKIQKEVVVFIKKNKHFLIEKFISKSHHVPDVQPLSIFMAGSPGAGKTEFSKRLLKENNINAVRIDADEIKTIIPQYTGKNSFQVQGASSLGVEYLHDYVLKKNLSMLLDGTFADYKKAHMNITRSLNEGRHVEIFYLYQNPLIAWQFTKAREVTEGRIVPKTLFVKFLFEARRNVKKIKKEFGDNIQLHIIIKNYKTRSETVYPDVDYEKVDHYVKIPYTQKALIKQL